MEQGVDSDFLSQGMDIDGVDNSPEMISLCKQNAESKGLKPNLYIQSMTELQLPRKTKTILKAVQFNAIATEPGLPLQAMQHFYDHLESGGVLAIPFMALWEKVLHSKVNSRRKRRDRKTGRRSAEVAGIASTLRQIWKIHATSGR